MAISIDALVRMTSGRLICGRADTSVSGVAEIDDAGATDLVFVEQEKDLQRALASRAGAVIAGEFAAAARTDKALLVCAQPKLAFVRAAACLCPPPRRPSGIDGTATVAESAVLGADVSVGARAIIEAHNGRIWVDNEPGRGVRICFSLPIQTAI